jgi:hypothetical protein
MTVRFPISENALFYCPHGRACENAFVLLRLKRKEEINPNEEEYCPDGCPDAGV